MPIPSGIPYDFREIANKMAMLLGILIVVYALLWILAELKLIPVVFICNISTNSSSFNRNIHCLYSLF